MTVPATYITEEVASVFRTRQLLPSFHPWLCTHLAAMPCSPDPPRVTNALSGLLMLRPPFIAIKEALVDATLLVHPQVDAPTCLITDASVVTVGAVLQQKINSMWSPIAFFSHKLQRAETRYSTFDCKLLAVYLAIKHFGISWKEGVSSWSLTINPSPSHLPIHPSSTRHIRSVIWTLCLNLPPIFAFCKVHLIWLLTLRPELRWTLYTLRLIPSHPSTSPPWLVRNRTTPHSPTLQVHPFNTSNR